MQPSLSEAKALHAAKAISEDMVWQQDDCHAVIAALSSSNANGEVFLLSPRGF